MPLNLHLCHVLHSILTTDLVFMFLHVGYLYLNGSVSLSLSPWVPSVQLDETHLFQLPHMIIRAAVSQ